MLRSWIDGALFRHVTESTVSILGHEQWDAICSHPSGPRVIVDELFKLPLFSKVWIDFPYAHVTNAKRPRFLGRQQHIV